MPDTIAQSNGQEYRKSFGEQFVDFISAWWLILVALATASGGFATLKVGQASQDKRLAAVECTVSDLKDRMVRVETKQDNTKEQLDRIERYVRPR